MKKLHDINRLPSRGSRKASWLIAIGLHLIALWLMHHTQPKLGPAEYADKGTRDERVQVEILERPKQAEGQRRQIVEAPMFPTKEAPDPDKAFPGRQNRRVQQEQKLPPSEHRQGAEATRYSSRSSSPAAEQPQGEDIVAQEPETGEGPRRGRPEGQSLAYVDLLPDSNEFAGYYNDFIADDSIPTGEVLDVNTTEYRYIGYFTSVRKQVDMAFYDPRSSLRDQPRIREQLVREGRINFRGVSVAQLTVLSNGMVTDSKIVRTSGDRELDEAWLRILNMAAPFPPLPHHFPDEQLVFNYSLYYDFALQESRQVRRYHF